MKIKIIISSILAAFLINGIAIASLLDRYEQHSVRLGEMDRNQAGDSYLIPSSSFSSSGTEVISDILISSSTGPANFLQDNAQIAEISNHRWLIIWEDYRLGVSKIFSQIIDSTGAQVGGNKLLAGSTTGKEFVDPRLSVDSLNRVYISWRDRTNGFIFVQRFNADMTPGSASFVVNDTSLSSFAGPHDLAVFPGGQLVVVWENYSSLGSTIDMKIFTPSLQTMVGPVTVNNDGGNSNHWVPSVAISPGSGFLVVWEDYRFGNADIFAQRYSGNGSTLGSNFAIVPPPNDLSPQYLPSVTYTVMGQYAIGWIDLRQGEEIYVQQYHQTLGLVGSNKLISSGLTTVINHDINLTPAGSTEIIATWAASGADNSIQQLRLDSTLDPAALPEIINLSATGQRWKPATSVSYNTNVSTIWTEFDGSDADITFMLFDSLGTRVLGAELVVNDDTTGAPSTQPSICASTDWWNLVCYTDRRNDAGDIFLRSISNSGLVSIGEYKVNQDIGLALQVEPKVAVSDFKGLVVWNDNRTLGGFSGSRIFGRYTTLLGELISNEFLISDSQSISVKSSPDISMLPDGRLLVAWIDVRDGSPQVYGQWLNADGSSNGSNFVISSSPVTTTAAYVQLGHDLAGNFYAAWVDLNATVRTIHIQSYNSSMVAQVPFEWSSTIAGVEIDRMVADISPDGTISLLWSGSVQSGKHKLYLTQLAGDGSGIITMPIEITDSPAADISELSLSISNNGYHSMAWIDSRDGKKRGYFQVYSETMLPLGGNLPVSNSDVEFMSNPTTSAFHGRAWFLWSDPRKDGLNIYGSTTIFLPTDIDDDPAFLLPESPILSQNYPNPFNPSTIITFELPVTSQISLDIFNALGQHVISLIDNKQLAAGKHTITWDSHDKQDSQVSSGVYFYKLSADNFTRTKKMMLLK